MMNNNVNVVEKKVSKMDWFNRIEEVVKASDYADKAGALEFIQHEKELLSKKSEKSKEGKSKKTNIKIIEEIKIVLSESEKPMTIPQMMSNSRLETYEEEKKDETVTMKMSSQKMSSLLKKLVDNGEVIKTYDKKKAFFSLNDKEE